MQRDQTPTRLGCCIVLNSAAAWSKKCSGAPCRVKIYRVKPALRDGNINGSGKVIVDPQSTPSCGSTPNLITSTGSPLANTYHVWSTSVNAFVSYPAHRQNERSHRLTPPASADGLITILANEIASQKVRLIWAEFMIYRNATCKIHFQTLHRPNHTTDIWA